MPAIYSVKTAAPAILEKINKLYTDLSVSHPDLDLTDVTMCKLIMTDILPQIASSLSVVDKPRTGIIELLSELNLIEDIQTPRELLIGMFLAIHNHAYKLGHTDGLDTAQAAIDDPKVTLFPNIHKETPRED